MQWQLARPLVALRDRLRRYGYTVYDIGDTRHMDHVPPEDHTPYSETGWPIATEYGWVTAIDIMPPGGGGLPSLQALGAQLAADRNTGVKAALWIKYMNWGPVDNQHAVQDRWQPGHSRGSSGDVGHIHLSSRSDALRSTVGDLYDPVALLRGQAGQDQQEEPMPFVAHDGKSGTYYVCDLITSRPVPEASVADVLYLAEQLNYGHGVEGVEWSHEGWVREGWTEGAFGTVQGSVEVGSVVVEVAQETVEGALEGARGQAALREAADAAEDS